METNLLGAFGKIAGIAGIGFGIFLVLFQGVLKQKILPDAGLSADQAYSIIVILMVMTFGIAVTGLVAWVVSKSTAQPPLSALLILVMLIFAVLGVAVFVTTKGAIRPENLPIKDLLPHTKKTADENFSTQVLDETDGHPAPNMEVQEATDATPRMEENSNETPPLTLEKLVESITKTSDKKEKNSLKLAARRLIASSFQFPDFSYIRTSQTTRTTQRMEYLNYDPVRNVLTLHLYKKTENNSNGPWKVIEEIDAAADVNLSKLDKIRTYPGEKFFEVDCNSPGASCIYYRDVAEKCYNSCPSTEDWYLRFDSDSNDSDLTNLKKAVINVMYKIDGRPPN